MTDRRPHALLVMARRHFQVQFHRPQLDRLARLVDLGDPLCVTELDSAAACRRLREADVLLTSWGAPRLTARRLAAAPRLRAVFHCAGTVRPLVSDELWRRGIVVTTAADANAVPVAEFTLAAIVFAGKKAPFLAQDARAHRADWSYADARGELSNRDRTIGVVGFSRVGRRVVERLRTLDVTVLVADPYADPALVRAAGARLVELPDLLRASDILSLHAPELRSTHHLIGAPELALLRDGATVINTARGSLVDTAALERECASGRLDAILDVTDPEPLPADSVLYALPNVMITPHVAGSLGAETRRLSDSAIDELERYLAGLPLRAEVTVDTLGMSA
ncbi:hydroxyacid dehydrogenase [Saccharothrix variisporea]|uniref:Phosphoglycerate dehydrogenase-like enzyme n=1 Tax=Saccharothrix variisporea TaxID=543527 RepID=A0A495WZQ5_9PSEU|nr:hydroxyacid dehydrogenase [Saccharothrix variisporea]RKT66859.1 phosphoglycerate dehydrogenase-like enzyme [Saccharothrix variisporea]